MNHCVITKCRSTENLIKNFYDKKRELQRYICRSCNTKRVRKYRATPNGKERTILAIKRSEARYPGKQAARAKLNYAIKMGEVKKPKKCQITACPETKIQGHHPSYSNAKFAVFLCTDHHRAFHQPL